MEVAQRPGEPVDPGDDTMTIHTVAAISTPVHRCYELDFSARLRR